MKHIDFGALAERLEEELPPRVENIAEISNAFGWKLLAALRAADEQAKRCAQLEEQADAAAWVTNQTAHQLIHTQRLLAETRRERDKAIGMAAAARALLEPILPHDELGHFTSHIRAALAKLDAALRETPVDSSTVPTAGR